MDDEQWTINNVLVSSGEVRVASKVIPIFTHISQARYLLLPKIAVTF